MDNSTGTNESDVLDFQEIAGKSFDALLTDEEATDIITNRDNTSVNYRAAVMMLTKSSDEMASDEGMADAFLDLAQCLTGQVEKTKHEIEMLETAQARLMVAVAKMLPETATE